MKKILFTACFLVLTMGLALAQNLTAKIVDSQSGESIPYANIRVNNENLISNEEGYFTLSEANSTDGSVLSISYLGYVGRQVSVGDIKNAGNVVKLQMGIVELDNVNVSNQKPDPNKIMAMAKSQLKKNYAFNGQPYKNTIFFRQSNLFKPSVVDVEIDKSTGFSKQNLREANSKLSNLTNAVIAHPPLEYTDILCNYYRANTTSADKQVPLAKYEVVKAVKLKSENRSSNMDDLQKQATQIMLQHLDSTKYYRIKSGMIGSRDTVSLRKDFNKKKNKKPENSQHTRSKENLMAFMTRNNLLTSKKLDFVNKTELYEYTYEGATYNGDQDFVYVIGFKPRKSKANYEGKLYISDTDYAVLRADYNLAAGKRISGLNLKLLLGVKFSDNHSKGTIIYRKNQVGDGYGLQYALEENGQYFYVHRPLKFIELTDKEEDVVKFDFKVEANTRDKVEFLTLSTGETTADAIEKLKETDFSFTTMNSYDPKVWKDYGAIEPIEEMKKFKAIN